MKLNLITCKEITDYESEIGVELVVTERAINSESRKGLYRYYALFEDTAIMDSSCLLYAHGNGNTIDEAIKDYCYRISNKKVAVNAFTPSRRNLIIPKLIHTKLLNQ